MSGFSLNTSSLTRGLERMQNKSDAAIRAFAETGGLKMQSYAQQNAKWTDRSGAARQRFKSGVERRESGYWIRLSYGVDYGIWLELAHEKKYAILPETIRAVGQEEIMPAFERFIERL